MIDWPLLWRVILSIRWSSHRPFLLVRQPFWMGLVCGLHAWGLRRTWRAVRFAWGLRP